jgi:hypothetical protein
MRKSTTLFAGRSATLLAFAVLAGLAPCPAQEPQPITLPTPQTEGGRPLMQALKERRTTREFSGERLSPQMLSNLLWAAFGVNRSQGPMGRPGRTAPSAMNAQEIDLYVATSDAVYLYEAGPHRLKPVIAGDIRVKTGRGPAAAQAAVTLIYVADYAKIEKVKQPELQIAFTNADVGFIGQNVYLFCASEGLMAWFRTTDRESLAKAMNLRPEQRVLYAQSVGYPIKK